MLVEETVRQEQINTLNAAVGEACEFFSRADPSLFDGHQNAKEVISHLVFWHREYAQTIKAISEDREPLLKSATFAELNVNAAASYNDWSMNELAQQLQVHQDQLAAVLIILPSWDVDFPVKCGGRFKSVADRLPSIRTHIQSHVRRLEKADRLGSDWVNAYFPEV